MGKYEKLIKNSTIMLIANFGSKILSFLLVPFYTHVLSTEQYGTADIIMTTVTMLFPIITLSIAEAALRFSMDHKDDSLPVLSNCIVVVGIGNALVLLAFPILMLFNTFSDYIGIFYILLFGNSFYVVISHFCRGLGKVKEFAIGGVISTISLIASNMISLLVLKLGVKGYLYSIAISYFIPLIYYCFVIRIVKYLSKPNKDLLKKMLIYSVPLIPNAFAWWAMQASDKYIVVHFWGSSANGIYVAAQKIPSILNVINGIFLQSWQISSVDEVNSKDKALFYSTVFKNLAGCMFIISSALIVIVRPLFSIWVEKMYYSAWEYTPILLLANVFSCFSGFVGTNYVAMKKTSGSLKTTLVGCVVNILLNFIFIPRFGLYAASFTTLLAFIITWILRTIDTRKFVKLNVNYVIIIISSCVIMLQFCMHMMSFSILFQVLALLMMLFLYRDELCVIYKRAIALIPKKKKKS